MLRRLSQGQGQEKENGNGAGLSTPPSGEAILDQALHLIMLALVEREDGFSIMAATRKFEEDRNLVDVICALEYHEQYKPYRARVQWILEQLSKWVPQEYLGWCRVRDQSRDLSGDLSRMVLVGETSACRRVLL